MARKRVNGLMGAADSDTAGQDSGKKGVIEALKILLPSSDVEMDKKVGASHPVRSKLPLRSTRFT